MHLPSTKDPPSPLNQDEFDNVKFWTKSSWNTYERAQKGATNGNAKKGKKHGWPEKETPNDNCNSLEPNTAHIYLENEDGIPVSKVLITQQGQKMCSLWMTLHKHDLAPKVWSKVDSFAVRFVDLAILNDPRFHYLGLCNNNWKLKYWVSKNYPSWVQNHLISDTVVKAKAEALNNENLLNISPEPLEPNQLSTNSHQELSDTLDSGMWWQVLIPLLKRIQVYSHLFRWRTCSRDSN
ncbi:hypothetical protein L208DRAFT_1287493 [Tricholoma matsutake]|nr:hypothetical protein L208DRAFT_1287493 [Tricholoma matsutake 945]